ncbi:CC0125/CC1285 family lipoprotein [Sandarakinorhabdus sp.]|jgi:hypothetical protein|uniref:CC0125/CC1285 family lipoprotein n=1 Tax=Sandarakinorhabdus sp. TaxID=1916663 RepID=UPI0028A99487|nr:hypothetical protein [Sandarakinorhabdus sp.]
MITRKTFKRPWVGMCGGIAAALVLAGCATSGSTPYQPASSANAVQGGYSEVRLAEDRYSVTFAGNRLTSREQVEASLLYRSAELTLQRGYDWFVIVDKETERQVERQAGIDPLYDPWFRRDYLYWRPYWRYYGPGMGWNYWYPYYGDPFWADRFRDRTVERFEATAEIRMGRGAMPATDVRAFDARDVIGRLGPQVRPPQP